MSGLDIGNIPDLPDERIDRIKKNWWIYLLVPACSLLTYLVTDYTQSRQAKPCNDMVIYLLKKIDSTNSSDMKFMRDQVHEAAKSK